MYVVLSQYAVRLTYKIYSIITSCCKTNIYDLCSIITYAIRPTYKIYVVLLHYAVRLTYKIYVVLLAINILKMSLREGNLE